MNINGDKSHKTCVVDAVQILVNLTHRGACGCEDNTGDGAGILLQVPHKLTESTKCAELGIKTCPSADRATGAWE